MFISPNIYLPLPHSADAPRPPRVAMIGETGLASVLPGILELGDLDRDTEAGEDRRIKTEYDIKTELPDSCSGIFLLVHP